MVFRPAYLTPVTRPWLRRLLVLVIVSGLAGHAGHAQDRSRPLFDGLTVAPGLAMYVGDLDGNPDSNPIQYFASGRIGFMVAADRRFGRKVSGGVELNFDQIKINRGDFELSNTMLSLDLVGGYHFDFIQTDFIRWSGGVGLTLLMPTYDRLPENNENVNSLGTRPVITFPVSVSIQDRVRLGVRFTLTDYLDGFEGQGGAGPYDLISFVRVGYRFNFVN